MPAVLEKDIEKYLVTQIRKHGGWAYKFTSPGNRGVPDRLCLLPGGQIFFVEVKREGGKVSPGQKVEKFRLEQLGQKSYIVWNKEDIDALIDMYLEV